MSDIKTITVNGTQYDIKDATARADCSDLKSAINADSTVKYNTSNNLFNKEAATLGYQINGIVGQQYSKYESTDRVITELIPCSKNDVFYITRINPTGQFLDKDNCNFVSAVAVDVNGIILKREDWVQGFAVDVDNAAFVIFTTTKTIFTTAKIISITKNYYPVSGKAISEYIKQKTIINPIQNDHIIDMWGDSRIANGWSDRTDVAQYLRTLLNQNIVSSPTYGIIYKNPVYVVSNYGAVGEASGMVAARFGSNEIFVSVNTDYIPATGEVTIPTIRCTTGHIENVDCYSTALTSAILCELNGVVGYVVKSQDTIKFVRKDDGDGVTLVKPQTKIKVQDYGSKNHTCIFQCGKNDMGLANGYQVNGTIGNMFGMASHLGHDRFIILGETYDCNTATYGTGTTLRGYVDQINAWYANEYPNNFIDIQSELITNGLALEGITPTAQDTANIANGFIPDSLMQDEIHPNAKGREATAKIIYAWMQAKGWV